MTEVVRGLGMWLVCMYTACGHHCSPIAPKLLKELRVILNGGGGGGGGEGAQV